MKPYLFIALALLLCLPGRALPATLQLPEIPTPKLTACEALAMATKKHPDLSKNCLLVAIEWCQPAKFHPRISSGMQWHFAKATEEWAWILTYVDRKAGEDYVIRVRNDGSVDIPAGTRT